MDDYVLYLTRDKFPPPAQSSLSGKRHTARISVVDQPCEDGLQGKNTNRDFFLIIIFSFMVGSGCPDHSIFAVYTYRLCCPETN